MGSTPEAAPTVYAPDDLHVDGYTDDQIAYHQHLMIEAGLAHGVDTIVMQSDSPSAQITSLTWRGHEFAEEARADTLWAKAKRFVIDKGGPMTLLVLQAVLKKLAAEQLGIKLD